MKQPTAGDTVGKVPYQILSACIIATSFAAYVFYMAFGKFYRRFSLETLMAFASNYAEEPPDDTGDIFAKSVLKPKPEKTTNQPPPKAQ